MEVLCLVRPSVQVYQQGRNKFGNKFRVILLDKVTCSPCKFRASTFVTESCEAVVICIPHWLYILAGKNAGNLQ